MIMQYASGTHTETTGVGYTYRDRMPRMAFVTPKIIPWQKYREILSYVWLCKCTNFAKSWKTLHSISNAAESRYVPDDGTYFAKP